MFDFAFAPETGATAAVSTILTAGDLTHNASGQYRGAFATLAGAAQDTVARLRDFAGRLAESAETVHTASAEISTGSQDLAHLVKVLTAFYRSSELP